MLPGVPCSPWVSAEGEISSFCVQPWGGARLRRAREGGAALWLLLHTQQSITFPGLVAGEETWENLFLLEKKNPIFGEGKEKLKRYLFYSILSVQRG